MGVCGGGWTRRSITTAEAEAAAAAEPPVAPHPFLYLSTIELAALPCSALPCPALLSARVSPGVCVSCLLKENSGAQNMNKKR